MKVARLATVEPALTDDDYLALARQALAQDAPLLLRSILADGNAHPDLWPSDAGQLLLVEILNLAIDALSGDHVEIAVEILSACPAEVAQSGLDLLVQAFFAGEETQDLTVLDDAALLCLTLLADRAGDPFRAFELLGEANRRRLGASMGYAARHVGDHISSGGKARFQAKLIIWDLDDTLWQGTLADGDVPLLNPWRANLLRSLNDHGVVSAICSKNDFETAKAQLEAFGLWDAFVFPRIAFLPKGEVVRQMIADMQLRPANVLFIDDNIRNLEEVAAASPGIRVIDATAPTCDALLQRILDDNRHVAKSRVADYRILEAKVADRQQSDQSDMAFLMQSGIEATFTSRLDNLDFAERIEELINRSNQLNYTESRIEPGTLGEMIMNVSDYDIFSAFVWDRYGYYGLVGTIVYDRRTGRPIHMAFSCRIMHMGVENFLLGALQQRYGAVDTSHLAKALPTLCATAISSLSFEQPEVRQRILATEAPRDWSKIRLRVMSDCMSGAFHHYSRFQDELDFDNMPRVFSLSMMMTDQHREQVFPEFLVYNTPVDYMEIRWGALMPVIDAAIYGAAQRAFCDMVVDSDRKLLLLLAPENASDHFHALQLHISGAERKAWDRQFNQLWRDAAARHPHHISVLDLTDLVTEADMIGHAYHYTPSALQRLTGLIDDWYEATSRPAP